MNIDKDLHQYFADEPPGLKTNCVRWLQKRIMRQVLTLPREFPTREAWETFRDRMRRDLPKVIGLPRFPPLGESVVRARVRVGADCILERVDVFVDDDYAIPTFVFLPVRPPGGPMPALVWNPGYAQDKYDPAYERFAVRMAAQGMVVLILDHAPFGETQLIPAPLSINMSFVMGMGSVLGISQLAMRAAETMRCGEYLRSRPDIDPHRVAVSGLCQGGMDTWLAAALDEGFCAAAPICAASTFAIHYAEMANYQANADASPFPFGILNVCDVDHLHAAIAPRPLLVRANLGDNWWPVSGFDCIEALSRKVYRLYDAEDRLDMRTEVHEHNLTGPFADALETFLRRYLMAEEKRYGF